MNQVSQKRREYSKNIRRESIQRKMKLMRSSVIINSCYDSFVEQVETMIKDNVVLNQVLIAIKNRLNKCFSQEYGCLCLAAVQIICSLSQRLVKSVKIEQFVELLDIIIRDIEEDQKQMLICPLYVNWMCEEVFDNWLSKGKLDEKVFDCVFQMSIHADFQSNQMVFDFQSAAEKIISSQLDYKDPSFLKMLSLVLWWSPRNGLSMKSKQKLHFLAKNIYRQSFSHGQDNLQEIRFLRCIGYHIDFKRQNIEILKACLTVGQNEIQTKMMMKFLDRQSWISQWLTYRDIEQAIQFMAKRINSKQFLEFLSTLRNVVINQVKQPETITHLYSVYFKNSLQLFLRKSCARIFAEFLSYFIDIGLADEDENLTYFIQKCLELYKSDIQKKVKWNLLIFLMWKKRIGESQLLCFLKEKQLKQFYSLLENFEQQQEDEC